MDIVRMLYGDKVHMLKRELIEARMNIPAGIFVAKALQQATVFAVIVTIVSIIFFVQLELPLLLVLLVFPGVFYLIFQMNLSVPKARIKTRGLEMNKEVLFAGRYLLIKLKSGKPLFNALIEASESYGIAGKYFKEIVDNVTFGTPIEEALEEAMEYSPSVWFKKILFQISSALKTGTDITVSLQATIDEIEDEQEIEIQRYGKKLSSISLFYMLLAIVMPSLGMTIFVVVSSLMAFPLDTPVYVIIGIVLVMIQLFFISVFRSIRPAVNL
ncbi:MAG: type II secretion system F family protein [Candidatus Woesearchaeota archaeon]